MDPIRLKDSPELLKELGLNLDAEKASLAQHDMAALKAQVEAAATAPAAAGITAKVAAKWAGLALLGGSALILALNGPFQEDREVAEPAPRQRVVKPQLAARSPVAPAPISKPKAKPLPKPLLVPAPAAPAPKAPVSRRARSSLAAQLSLYEKGQAQLEQQNFEKAAEVFGTYTRKYPKGRLYVEAGLGRLEALYRLKKHAEAAEWAKNLLKDPRYTSRIGEIRRILAELELAQGHCVAAKQWAQDLPPELAAAVAACKEGAAPGED